VSRLSNLGPMSTLSRSVITSIFLQEPVNMSFARKLLTIWSKIETQEPSADAKICSLVARNVLGTELSVMFASPDTRVIKTATNKSANPATCGVTFAELVILS
jgi:hypothetical protein